MCWGKIGARVGTGSNFRVSVLPCGFNWPRVRLAGGAPHALSPFAPCRSTAGASLLLNSSWPASSAACACSCCHPVPPSSTARWNAPSALIPRSSIRSRPVRLEMKKLNRELRQWERIYQHRASSPVFGDTSLPSSSCFAVHLHERNEKVSLIYWTSTLSCNVSCFQVSFRPFWKSSLAIFPRCGFEERMHAGHVSRARG